MYKAYRHKQNCQLHLFDMKPDMNLYDEVEVKAEGWEILPPEEFVTVSKKMLIDAYTGTGNRFKGTDIHEFFKRLGFK